MNSNTFTSLLQLLFITLKLTGHLTWSWWWVLSPTWISFVIAAIDVGFLLVYYTWFESEEDRNRRILVGYLKK